MINNLAFTSKYNTRKKYFETPYNLEYILNDKYLNEILEQYFVYLAGKLDEGTTHISLITRVETSDLEVYTLGNKHVLNLESKDDILKYFNTVISKFNEHFHTSQNYDPIFLRKIIFVHSIANKNTYTNFTRKINRYNSLLLDRQISKGIIDKYNLPFDNLYMSWGNIEHISSSQFKISNVYFNGNIDYVVITTIGSFRNTINRINIMFIDKSTVSIVDTMQLDGYVKRVCIDSSGKTDYLYTYNPVLNTPDLYLNYNKLPKLYSKVSSTRKSRIGSPSFGEATSLYKPRIGLVSL